MLREEDYNGICNVILTVGKVGVSMGLMFMACVITRYIFK